MDILKLIEDYRVTYLGEDFVWRVGQVSAITTIVETYIEGKVKVVILNAPTGAGKSAIAMCSTWIMNQLKATGYILTSDLALQEQYQKDFKKFNINFGNVSGIDNYECTDNFEKNSLGTCRIRGKKPKSMPCYSECPYFSARDHASQSSTALLNYSYYLIMMNYVNEQMDESPFKPRQFTFADEAHKLLDIVQNHFSPKIDKNFIDKLEKLTSFLKVYKVHDHTKELHLVKMVIKDIYVEEDNTKILALLNRLRVMLGSYLQTYVDLKKVVSENYKNSTIPKEWRSSLKTCDWVKDFHCKVEDYCKIIEETDIINLVKNRRDEEIVFNCLEENYLMDKYFHRWSGFTVLMSATFGSERAFLKSINVKNAKLIKMESTFDFEKSPIYFFNKRRMSKRDMEGNLPWMYDKIDQILSLFPNDNGIIHTVSYDLALKIFKNISMASRKRLLVFDGSKEKREALENLKGSTGKVILGPGMNEGISLDDDFARFAILAKTPYLSLADKFIKAKMELDPIWYKEKAIVNILQTVGRAHRSNEDFVKTYYLDACLGDLLTTSRNSFPQEFLSRIRLLDD